jgi:List-Bact-rpt repeat protein
VDNPSNSPADAAYGRALAAFQEKSYEVARRWVMEALAHNRQHAGARALMARLDAARSAASPFQGPAASEVISTDPTVLIGRAGRSATASEGIEPTVLVRRDDVGHRSSDTDPRVSFPPLPPRSSTRSTAEPTMVGQPRGKSSSSRAKSTFSVGAVLQSLGDRLQRGTDRQRSSSTGRKGSTGSVLSSPGARGAMLALGTVVVGALLVWILFAMVRWVFPAGQLLTITKPVGGTLKGPGIECGTGGVRCSTSVTKGEPIELDAQPDKDYVFSGYTGDCAPAGRTSMTEPRTCGATFDPVAKTQPPVAFRLTITKPEGGTIVGNGGIYCGTNGAMCTADIPSGVPVSLKAESDDGFSFQQFTGDCPSTGEMTMTSAKTCGAAFAKSLSPINATAHPPVADNLPRPRPQPVPRTATAPPQPTVATPGPSPTKPAPSGGTPTSPAPTPSDPGKPAAAPISAEEHAKQEIGQLVNNYCTAMQSLKPSTIRPLFHLDNERELKEKFKEYKSLQCTVTAPPTFDRLDPNAAGGAQIKFGMKQVVKMASGGAPETIETIVTMVVSRKDFQSPWLIDRVSHEPKPK